MFNIKLYIIPFSTPKCPWVVLHKLIQPARAGLLYTGVDVAAEGTPGAWFVAGVIFTEQEEGRAGGSVCIACWLCCIAVL